MKKHIFMRLITLVVLLSATLQVAAQEPYAVLSEGNTKLTFYYDDQKISRGGMGVGPFSGPSDRPWNSVREDITNIAFDDSFVYCTSLTSTAYWFWECKNLTEIKGIKNLKTANVSSMERMFNKCSSLTILDVSSFNTANVTSMESMFRGCSSLTALNLKNFITTNVTDMNYLFAGCSSLTTLDVSSFNTTNVTNMKDMFSGCSSLTTLDVSSFNTTNVTNMNYLFAGCSSLTTLDVSSFNTENAETMKFMFSSCSGLTILDLSSFNTAKVEEMDHMFDYCTSLTTIYVSNLWTTVNAFNNGTTMFALCTNLVGGNGTHYDANHDNCTYAHIDGGTANPGYFTDIVDNKEAYAVLSSNNTILTFYYDHLKKTRGGLSVGPFNDSNDQSWRSARELITSVVFDNSFVNCTTITNTDFWFYGCKNVVSITGIENLKTDNVTRMNSMFMGCSSLKSLNVSNFNTTKVTYMGHMFDGCSSLTSLDVRNFDTSNVTGMGSLFDGCSGLTSLDVTNFDTSKAKEMQYMFADCSSLTSIDVSNFNTTNVELMYSMFARCYGLTSLDITNFNTAKVVWMDEMFSGCSSLRTIYVGKDWTTEHFNSGAPFNMFTDCVALVGGDGTTYSADHINNTYARIDDVPDNPGYFTDKNAPAREAYALLTDNEDEVTKADGTKVKGKTLTFYYDRNKTEHGLGVGPFNDSNDQSWRSDRELITSVVFDNTFAYCTSLTSTAHWFYLCKNMTNITGIENLKTANVTNMYCMFYNCSGLTSPDLSNFNTGKVTDMSSMFSGCSGLTSLDLTNFNTANVENMSYMFSYCSGLTSLDVSKFNTGNVTSMKHMFVACPGLTSLDLSKFNTVKVTDMGGMFYNCSGLTNLDVSNFNTANVTDMSHMFDGCSGLTSLDVSSFITANVTDMKFMFSGCSGLTSLDLNNFSTAKITSLSGLFSSCSGLTTITVGDDWNTTGINIGSGTFDGCTKLVGGEGTPFSTAHTDYTYAHVDGGVSNPGYLTYKQALPLEPYAVLTDNDDEIANEDGSKVKGKTLTFYYNSKKADNSGLSVEPFDGVSSQSWRSSRELITSVVFDNTFINCTTITSTDYWFFGCKNIASVTGTEYLKTDNVESMRYMFYNCSSLKSLDVSKFNTAKVTDMSYMFRGCSSLADLDVSNFSSHSASIEHMFEGCSSLSSINLSNINTEYVSNMASLFQGCSSLTNLNLGDINTADVSDMNNMFSGCSSLAEIDLSKFNTTKVENMANMFSGCSSLENLDLSKLNTSNVKWMNGMFSGCSSLKSIDLSKFNTTNVMGMQSMFKGCSSLESLNLDNFDTSNVTTMDGMFANCSGLTSLDLNKFNTAKVTNMNSMFSNCSSLTSLEVSSFNTSNVTDMYLMFAGFSSLTSLDLSKFNTAKVTRMGYMFYESSSLESLDLSKFNTDNVTGMDGMFSHCSGLTSLDVSNFNTTNVTDMNGMFNRCSGLTSLDLSSFKTTNVANMHGMFLLCSELTTIYVGDAWTTKKVTEGDTMFNGCAKLVGGNGTTYNSEHEDYTYARIDYGIDKPGYFTDKSVSDPEAYAELTENEEEIEINESTKVKGKTLTFYYDKKKKIRKNTMSVGPFSDYSDQSWYSDSERITTVVFDTSFANCDTLTSTANWFFGCSNLTSLRGLGNFKTDNVTDMTSMFESCKSLKQLDLGGFNTGNVTTMSGMFYNCESLEDVTLLLFNTEKVTDMYGMFSGCSSLKSLDLISFNTQKVKDMGSMFYGCSSLKTIYVGLGWDTEAVTESAFMFSYCDSIVGSARTPYNSAFTDITYAHIDGGTSNPGYLSEKAPEPYAALTDNDDDVTTDNGTVKGKTLTFYYDGHKAERNGMSVRPFSSTLSRDWFDLSTYITTVVFDKSFDNCTTLTSTAYWFYNCGNLNSISGLNYLHTDSVTNMSGMFVWCQKLTDLDVSMFNTAKVTDMSDMFFNCSSLTSIDVSNFDTRKVTNMESMFECCSSVESLNLSGFVTENVTNMSRMFRECSKLTSLDFSSFNTAKVTDMNGMFFMCTGISSLDLSKFITANVTNMSGMFYRCYGLNSLDVSSFNTKQVTDMSGMFRECTSLTSINVRYFETESVIDMSEMFTNCSGISNLDISSFNTKKVTNMWNMFYGCTNLQTIYVGDEWNTNNVPEGNSVFYACGALVGGAGTKYDPSHTDVSYARIDDPDNEKPGYFTFIGIPGDVNGDGVVNIADAQAMVSYILGTYEGDFGVNLADLNGDGSIDIFDVTLVVNITLEDDTNNPSGSRALTRGDISQAEIMRVKAEGNDISLAVDEAERYTAFQFDMKLPEDVKLTSVKLASDIPDYLLKFVEHQGNRYRVIGLSLSNELLSTVDGQLIKLIVSDSVDETGVSIDNVLFVTPGNKVATLIGAIEYLQQAEDGNIYNLNGQRMNANKQQLRKGVYIINHKKVIIK